MPPIIRPELVAGGAAQAIILNQRLSPRLMDALLMRTAFKLQKTDEPKPEGAPENLFEPIGSHDTSADGFGGQALQRSLYNWLETHPTAKLGAAAGAALGLFALLRGRS